MKHTQGFVSFMDQYTCIPDCFYISGFQLKAMWLPIS